MNDKGFGVLALLAFIAFAGIALLVMFSFITKTLPMEIFQTKDSSNYKNVYAVYIKEHSIDSNIKNN